MAESANGWHAVCLPTARALTQLLDSDYAKIAMKGIIWRRSTSGSANAFRRLTREREHLEDAKQVNKRLEAQLEQNRRHRPGMLSHERSISGGLQLEKHTSASQTPNLHYSKPAVPVINAVHLPTRSTSPKAPRRPASSDLQKSSESLINYSLRTRTSGSRLPQPMDPSTPIRSGTPSTPRDTNFTDSTVDSMASLIFSRISRRTTSSGLSPNLSPSALKILVEPEQRSADSPECGKTAGPAILESHASMWQGTS
ncbi:putative Kinase-like domain-containing protein [Seiridium cardinale]|uniref:Kinase-like domain-containing protein n=1 Tax=Seiridium cardinale TaxID=138064 RepID=A0ABR2XJQ9_9PEZI